mmetsp:Transcript_50047/g.108450  ORF Transcript_50047/g.108450 Transcript_50047/m.108450 type:complete len:501 (+) Transcript_50047:197-1699(+)
MYTLATDETKQDAERPRTIVYAPGLREMAMGLEERLGGCEALLCTSDEDESLSPSLNSGVCWDSFPSGDPNVKLRIDAIRDRDVIFIMSHRTEYLFEQLAVLQFLLRFNVPRPLQSYADGKWKRSLPDGEYDECSVHSLTVVVPWYRFCQMERTCRWTVSSGKWHNGKATGEYVDVPTAQSFASLLSSQPTSGKRPLPPKQLLLLDIHEYEDLERTLDASNSWSNRSVAYDFTLGGGTYFSSAFRHFLKRVLLPSLSSVSSTFVVFPDHGAHRRFATMVQDCLPGIGAANVLWISKSRVGANITQEDGFQYSDARGTPHKMASSFPHGSRVLIADDFTNSGSTLFGGADIIRRHAQGEVHVSAYVTHFVAKYDTKTVEAFVNKLYSESERSLDDFHCTDSVADVVATLAQRVKKHVANGEPKRAHVMPLAAVIAEWINAQAPLAPRSGGNGVSCGDKSCCAAALTPVTKPKRTLCALSSALTLLAGAALGALVTVLAISA